MDLLSFATDFRLLNAEQVTAKPGTAFTTRNDEIKDHLKLKAWGEFGDL